jgi:hypothetical protein
MAFLGRGVEATPLPALCLSSLSDAASGQSRQQDLTFVLVALAIIRLSKGSPRV